MPSDEFKPLRRQQFRRYFQPSRIFLGVIPAPTESGVNVITLCFGMYCSYEPPMMAVAIQNVNRSFALIHEARDFVLAVPGPSLLKETVFCGTQSLAKVDKVKALGIGLIQSSTVATPGLSNAIANIELVRESLVPAGDHVIVLGRVSKFGVNRNRKERPLLSIGPDVTGYKLLAKEGIHRIATIED